MAFIVAGLDLCIKRISSKAVDVDIIPRKLKGVLLLQQLLKLRLLKGL